MLAFIYARLQLIWVLDERERGRGSLVAGRSALALLLGTDGRLAELERSVLETGRGCSVAGRREEEAFSGRVVQANDSCCSAQEESLKGALSCGSEVLRIQATDAAASGLGAPVFRGNDEPMAAEAGVKWGMLCTLCATKERPFPLKWVGASSNDRLKLTSAHVRARGWPVVRARVGGSSQRGSCAAAYARLNLCALAA